MTDDVAAALDAERPALRGLAYRMLGSLSDAEDAVQDAFVRWVRLTDAQRSAIENPGDDAGDLAHLPRHARVGSSTS